MKILVWNVRRAAKARSGIWEYFREIAPDLALLQEVASLPSWISSEYSCLQRRAHAQDGRQQRFHTSLLVKGSIVGSLELTTASEWVNAQLKAYAGNLVAAQISLASGENFRAVSVHSPAWPIVNRAQLNEVDAAAIKLEHSPDLWLTEILWAGLKHQDINRLPWIVGGDLNSSVTFDTMWKGGPHGNQEIQDRMHSLGFIECLQHAQGGLTPTFINPSDRRVIHQTDHLFISSAIVSRLVSCAVGSPERVFGRSLSDHLPIIAELAPPT